MQRFKGVDWSTYVRKRNQDRYDNGEELPELVNEDNILLDEIDEPKEEEEDEPEEAEAEKPAEEEAPAEGAQIEEQPPPEELDEEKKKELEEKKK
jgi:hypothetical protein